MEALARGYLVRYTTLDDLVRGLRHADALGKVNQGSRSRATTRGPVTLDAGMAATCCTGASGS